MSANAHTLTIRGRTLNVEDLLDRRLSDAKYLESIRDQIAHAQPFPHLCVEGWFNPTLLELINEEFDNGPYATMRAVEGLHEKTRRSPVGVELGPATQTYFNLVNSGRFVKILSYITGVPDLVTDPHLFGGGLHETTKGGRFDVHRDFDRHMRTGLNNEMVFITYLNKNWQTAWEGELELWNQDANACVKRIAPEFGRTVLLKHGPHSYHGHPAPLAPPPGVTRRSIAAYYYANLFAHEDRVLRETSVFLHEPPPLPVEKWGGIKKLARGLTPPLVWDALARLKNH